jgi:hypothetical protein
VKEKLNEIMRLIYEGLGEWAVKHYVYCPPWTMPFKKAAVKAEDSAG